VRACVHAWSKSMCISVLYMCMRARAHKCMFACCTCWEEHLKQSAVIMAWEKNIMKCLR